jgi:purine nucleosidase
VALALLGTAAPVAADPVHPPDVIVDTDMSFDDVAALSYLAEEASQRLVTIEAVTVSTAGIAYPGRGLGHARCLLTRLGLDVPTSDGDLPARYPVPDAVRGPSDQLVADALGDCPSSRSEGGAADLLVSTLLAAPGEVQLILLGPLTDLVEALQRNPAVADKIGGVVLMGGSTTHGNLDWDPAFDDSQEFNIWADAPAAQAAFTALSGRIALTPLNATDAVPVTASFRDRLAGDRETVAAEIVYRIAADLSTGGGSTPLYWWDPLAVVAATVDGVETFAPAQLRVVQGGRADGRTEACSAGATVWFGVAAATGRFEDAFIDGLNGRFDGRRPGQPAATS